MTLVYKHKSCIRSTRQVSGTNYKPRSCVYLAVASETLAPLIRVTIVGLGGAWPGWQRLLQATYRDCRFGSDSEFEFKLDSLTTSAPGPRLEGSAGESGPQGVPQWRQAAARHGLDSALGSCTPLQRLPGLTAVRPLCVTQAVRSHTSLTRSQGSRQDDGTRLYPSQ